MATITQTPLMKQFQEMKRRHPDAILLFRVGDFYETFGEDAVATSQVLNITLTRRANGDFPHTELAGFPHHALDTYLPKLVRSGKRVAICEQLEDPIQSKRRVERKVVEEIIPAKKDTSLTANIDKTMAAAVETGAKSIQLTLDLNFD